MQGIVGVREDPKNTGKVKMEGVAGNGKVVSPVYSNCPTKSPPNVPPKQGETSDQAIRAFLDPLKKYIAGKKARGGNLDIPKNPNGDLKEPEDGVPPECVTPYQGVGNFKQVVLKRALQWNKTPSTSTTCHPSTSKTKVVVDVEGAGLAVSESDKFISGPDFFKDARCGLGTGKGPIHANGKERNSGFVCESSYTITFDHNRKCLTCDTDHLVF